MTNCLYFLVCDDGRRFGIRQDGGVWVNDARITRGPVIVDLDGDVEVGQAGATCAAIVLDAGPQPTVLFAGCIEDESHVYTSINGTPFVVSRGVWMGCLDDIDLGSAVTVAGLDEKRHELFRLELGPLDATSPTLGFGPSWTGFASEEP